MTTNLELDDAVRSFAADPDGNAVTERTQLVDTLRQIVDPFPMSPRVRTILGKLEPPQAPAEPYPALKGPGQPSMVLAKKRRR